MNASRRNITAFSLVELLVVLAIVGILAGIAVPTLMRLGVFSFNKVDAAARDVFGVMRAARMFAAVNRCDTAVLYYVTTAPGGEYVVSGLGVARQMTEDELNDSGAFSGNAVSNRTQYVMLDTSDARFRKMPGDTCILLNNFPETWEAEYGFSVLKPWQNDDGVWTQLDPDQTFYAHVFSPAGHAVCPDTSAMRCRVTVTNMPGDGTAEDEIRMAGVELAVATGRPKLVEVNP